MWVAALVALSVLVAPSQGQEGQDLPTDSEFANVYPWVKSSYDLQHLSPAVHGWVEKGGMAMVNSWSLHKIHERYRRDTFNVRAGCAHGWLRTVCIDRTGRQLDCA